MALCNLTTWWRNSTAKSENHLHSELYHNFSIVYTPTLWKHVSSVLLCVSCFLHWKTVNLVWSYFPSYFVPEKIEKLSEVELRKLVNQLHQHSFPNSSNVASFLLDFETCNFLNWRNLYYGCQRTLQDWHEPHLILRSEEIQHKLWTTNFYAL